MPVKTTEEKKSGRSSRGWGDLARRQAEVAKEREDKENRVREFWLMSDESAIVQFLSDEPFCYNAHVVKKNGKFTTIPCGLDVRKHCALCSSGVRQVWKAAFKVLDYRGSWDADKKKFTYDEPVEKMWIMGATLATQIKQIIDKKGRALTSMVFDVSRSGSGKNSTYNFEIALGDDDRRLRPKDWEETTPDLDEILVPPTNDEMEAAGYTDEDDMPF